MELDQIKAIIGMMKENDLSEFSMEQDGLKIRIKRGPEGFIVGQRLQLLKLLEVRDPAIADGLGDRADQGGVREQQPAAGRDPVGLVAEAVGENLRLVFDGHGAQQPRMDGGDAVDGEAADDAEIRHADVLHVAFLDDGHGALPYR